MDRKIKVTVWNEFRHEKTLDGARDIYPDGIHACIKSFLDEAGCEVRLAALDDPDQGSARTASSTIPMSSSGGDIWLMKRLTTGLSKG